VEHRRVQVLDRHGMFDRRARTLVGGFSVEHPFLIPPPNSTTEPAAVKWRCMP
jgi:hypothetical protein